MVKQPRRRFLQSATAATAGTMACSLEAEAQVLAKPAADGGPIVSSGPSIKLPKVKLGNWEVSRLIVGANPFYGYAHFNRLFGQHMVEWATPERVCDVLKHC